MIRGPQPKTPGSTVIPWGYGEDFVYLYLVKLTDILKLKTERPSLELEVCDYSNKHYLLYSLLRFSGGGKFVGLQHNTFISLQIAYHFCDNY